MLVLNSPLAQVDRSSEEPDGEAERTNHYAEAGSAATKGSSPGKNVPNAGSESPKPGRQISLPLVFLAIDMEPGSRLNSGLSTE